MQSALCNVGPGLPLKDVQGCQVGLARFRDTAKTTTQCESTPPKLHHTGPKVASTRGAFPQFYIFLSSASVVVGPL